VAIFGETLRFFQYFRFNISLYKFDMLVTMLSVIAGILLIAAIITLTDNFIQIEGQKAGLDTAENSLSLFPKLSELFGDKAPASINPSQFHVIKKGHDINLVGAASGEVQEVRTSRYAVMPQNFRGIAPIPKMLVKEGDEVKAGEALFYDKFNPRLKFVTPVSGEVVEIRRGEKRAISHVIILADKTDSYVSTKVPDLEKANRAELVDFLLETGFWPFINKRPFDTIPDPEVVPRDVFISTFDTSPLAPKTDMVMAGNENAFNRGLEVLTQLTAGKVYVGREAGDQNLSPSNEQIETHYFKGPHPAGNVGVQIHKIKPIKSADTVWTLKPADVVNLGNLFLTGNLNTDKVIAVTGAGVINPGYFKVKPGADLSEVLEGNIKSNNYRVISGNVLTGETVGQDGFLGSFANQVTTLEEGNHHEMFGWLLPLSPRPSISGTFPNKLFKDHNFEANTNTHGEKRAFVVTGQYESMLPMDIYPQHLMKAILVNDYERMEGLGIYELSEEDLALCEFACTSKMPLQKILRQGLNMVEEQS